MRLPIKVIVTMTGFLLIAVGLSILGCALANKFLSTPAYIPPTLSAKKATPPVETKYRPFVRLHDSKGVFFCSGVVVSDSLVATANHCVANPTFFGPPSFIDSMQVRPENGKDIGVTAKVVGGNSRSDTAMIIGDFSKFQKQPLLSDTRIVNSLSLNNHITLVSCGFPHGDRLYCTPITNRYYFNSAILAKGLLYPGMSGGPVMIEETGEVVAVNTAVQGNNVIVSPTSSIYVITGAKKQ